MVTFREFDRRIEALRFDLETVPMVSIGVVECAEFVRTATERRIEYLQGELRELVRHHKVRLFTWRTFIQLDWKVEFKRLLTRILSMGLGLNEAQVLYARELAQTDPHAGCYFLIQQAEAALTTKLNWLAARLGLARLLESEAARPAIYKFHGQATLQREWFLHHGAHPPRSRSDSAGSFLRVCTPAVLQA